MTTTVTQAFEFSLQGAWLATNNGDGTFGTKVTAPSAKTLTVTIEYIHDKAEGNSRIVAMASQIVSVGWQLDGVNLSPDMIGVITGQAPTSSGSGVNEVDTITLSNNLMPYFGIIGQAWGENGSDECFLLPYSKVMDGWNYKLDYGKYIMPQFKGESIEDPVLLYMIQQKWHATKLTAPAFPPAWA